MAAKIPAAIAHPMNPKGDLGTKQHHTENRQWLQPFEEN
jgi:hypothetical protein